MTERTKLRNDSLYNPVGREVGLTAECPNCEELIPVFGYTCGYCGYKIHIEFVAEEIEHEEGDELVTKEDIK